MLKSSFQEFYTMTLEYVDKWFHLVNRSTHVNWILLRDQIVEYEEVVDLAPQFNPEIEIMDEVFKQVSALNVLLQKVPVDTFRKEKVESK